jgi:hypothetical protein
MTPSLYTEGVEVPGDSLPMEASSPFVSILVESPFSDYLFDRHSHRTINSSAVLFASFHRKWAVRLTNSIR